MLAWYVGVVLVVTAVLVAVSLGEQAAREQRAQARPTGEAGRPRQRITQRLVTVRYERPDDGHDGVMRATAAGHCAVAWAPVTTSRPAQPARWLDHGGR